MDAMLKTSLWQQFGAALDTLDDAITLCPDHLWTTQVWKDPEDACYGQYWWIASHAVMWTDLFFGGTMEGFLPPSPFIRGGLPDQPYTKADVRGYLLHCRQKAHDLFMELTDEQANKVCVFKWMEPTYFELQLYSMRHIQEHAAQLNLVLGGHEVEGLDWVPSAREKVLTTEQ
jgi:hypothetical protein